MAPLLPIGCDELAESLRSTRMIIGLLLLTLVTGAAVVMIPHVPREVTILVSAVLFALNAIAGALVIRRLVTDAALDRRTTGAWAVIGCAICALFIGHLGRFAQAGGTVRVITEIIALASHGLLLAGVLLMPTGRRSRLDRFRLVLDVLVTAGAVTALALTFLPGAYGGSLPTPGALPVVWLAVSNALLFATVASLWLRGMVTRLSDAYVPLAFACLIQSVLPMMMAIARDHRLGNIAQALTVMPYALIGLSAVWQRNALRRGIGCAVPRRLSLLPTTAAGAVLFALLSGTALGAPPSRLAVLTAAVVGLTALVRQVIGIRSELASREQSALELGDRRLAALVRHGSDMITILDPDTTVRYASPSHLDIVGIPPEMMVGRRMDEQIHRDDLAAAALGFERLRADGASARESLIVRLRDATGTWRWIEAVGTNLLAEPSIGGLVLHSRDITDRKALEAQLIAQALRDPLTGLGNRRLLRDRVAHALERRARSGSQVALLLLDLDHFKLVNDTMGHAMGDALLTAVSDRLRHVVRAGDTVVRLGGDEFAVLLEDLATDDEAEATAVRIQEALDRPFRLEDREVFARASIGIAWAADDQDVDSLLMDADVAMYAAKTAGRARIERFSSAMRARVAERVDLESDLRLALQRGELDLVYQPVVDLTTGVVSGAEALIRWTHPQHGMVLPGRFIPVAEESNLIIDIGRFVIRRAVADAVDFRAVNSTSARLRVAVNLSARHLLSSELVADVTDALTGAGLSGQAFAVEITESVLASNEPTIAGRLEALRALGVRIALDDFGTGYSSLAYLRRFPIDVLKVDKSFVSYGQTATSSDGGNDGVTQAIVSIGQSLGMRTVAEGIETVEQLKRLRDLGCTLGQGYLFSRPVDRTAFVELLNAWDSAAYRPREEPNEATAAVR